MELQKVWAGEVCKGLTPCFRNGDMEPRKGANDSHSWSQGWLSTPGVLAPALLLSPARMQLVGREESAESKASKLLQKSLLFSCVCFVLFPFQLG